MRAESGDGTIEGVPPLPQVRRRMAGSGVSSSDGVREREAAAGFSFTDFTSLSERERIQLRRERRLRFERAWENFAGEKNSSTTLALFFLYTDIIARAAVRVLGLLLRIAIMTLATPLWLPGRCLRCKDRGAPDLTELEGGRADRRRTWRVSFERWFHRNFTRVIGVLVALPIGLIITWVIYAWFAPQQHLPTREDIMRGKADARHIDTSFEFLDDTERLHLMREVCEPVTAEEMKTGLFAKGWRIADVEDAMVDALTDTYAGPWAAGLAAVHVRVNKCMVVVRGDTTRDADGGETQPLHVLLNPHVIKTGGDVADVSESSLFCGDGRDRLVQRHPSILVRSTQWARDDVCADDDCVFAERLQERTQFNGALAGIVEHVVDQTRGDHICNAPLA